MFYGYESTDKDTQLYTLLCLGLNLPGEYFPGSTPYVEIDEYGVRIRRITHLSDEEQKVLVKKADDIYNKLMGKEIP